MLSHIDLLDRFRGAIVGMAVGDALGHPTEFVSSVDAIRRRWGPRGVTGFEATGRHPAGTFTDDTQMAIAVARALLRAGHAPLDQLMAAMGEEFVTWSRCSDNNRAPGGACMSGCRQLAVGTPWRKAGVEASKGCGAAMRAAPVGLLFHHDQNLLVRISAAQSAPTHRHPTGYASSVAAAAAVAWAARGGALDGLLDFVEACVARLDESQLVEMGCEASLIRRHGTGDEMLRALALTRSAVDKEADDVCRLLGGAWIGEEAVACALWCVLRADGGFSESVLRGANSSGDSDSIACIAGSIAGAWGGFEAIPEDWAADVEAAAMLDVLSRALHASFTSGQDTPELSADLPVFRARERESLSYGPDTEAEEAEPLDDDTDFFVEEPEPDDLESLSADELAEQVAYHNRLYWDDDAPEISDVAYDRLVRRLQEIAPDSPVLDSMGPSLPPMGTAVRHREPMLSLDKCYADEDLLRWLESFGGDVVAMPKLDGVACSLSYDAKGRLRVAATRGDGAVGDDVSRNAVAIEAIPNRIEVDQPLEVRGELYMRLSVFARYQAEGNANPRNLTAGAIKQKDPAKSAAYELSFAPYDALGLEEATQVAVLSRLADLGFEAVEYQVLARENVASAYREFEGRRSSLDYEIDGVVYRANLIAEQLRLGQTSHHPRYALAYKFQGESGSSVLRTVEWSVARTGAITPVAVVDPVPLSGVTVTRASLHHAGMVRKLKLTLGAEVVLTRRGGVIPNLERVVAPGPEAVAIPETCPACGTAVCWQDDFLFCGDPANCRQTLIGRLAHWAGTTGILGFGPVLLEKAYDASLLRSPVDFYVLDWQSLAACEGFGETIAKKLVTEIATRRSVELATFLRALGLPELGKHVSRVLAERFSDLDAVLAVRAEELTEIPSIGETIARAVVDGLAEAAPLVSKLRERVTIVGGQAGTGAASGVVGPLAGRSFVLTGTLTLPRKEAEEAIRKLGGSVSDSVGPDLSYLVLGQSKGTSSKEKAARRRIAEGASLAILDEQVFLALLREYGLNLASTDTSTRDQLSLF